MNSVLDPVFNDMSRVDLYRATVFPDMYPDQGQMLIDNWTAEDREMYCGGEYAKGVA